MKISRRKVVLFALILSCLIVPLLAREFHGAKGIEKMRDSEYFWNLLKSSFFGSNPRASGTGGGTNCAACTGVVAMIEQLAYIHDAPIITVMEKFCDKFKFPIKQVCVGFVDAYGGAIINLLELQETPDRVCQQLGVCTDLQCNLFPPPIKEVIERNAKLDIQSMIRPLILPFALNLTGTIGEMINRFVNEHEPFFDLDGDKFSDWTTLRGTSWRGRDCDDTKSNVYPGRKATNDSADIDANCNGIYGKSPEGYDYESLLCSDTPYYGMAILGDSAAAHFHIPPQWVSPLNITINTYDDLIPILANELDWPEMSATTGYTNNMWMGHPIGPVLSSYLYGYEANHCTFRDYQNIGVNGARSSSMAETIMYSYARNQQDDFPVILMYALLGNDVCNPHPGVSHMTTPQEFYDNVLTALQYLDTQLPMGSQVVMMGLANGLVLWDAMHDRIHPLGELRQDVTYADLYDYLNCLEISPCYGWLNSNETMRLITQARADELSAMYPLLIKNNKFEHFNMTYTPCPVKQVIDIWESNGGQAWQLIEPVDGFHPNQMGNALIADYMWKYFAEYNPYLVPPTNPNNEEIRRLFGDQGGY